MMAMAPSPFLASGRRFMRDLCMRPSSMRASPSASPFYPCHAIDEMLHPVESCRQSAEYQRSEESEAGDEELPHPASAADNRSMLRGRNGSRSRRHRARIIAAVQNILPQRIHLLRYAILVPGVLRTEHPIALFPFRGCMLRGCVLGRRGSTGPFRFEHSTLYDPCRRRRHRRLRRRGPFRRKNGFFVRYLFHHIRPEFIKHLAALPLI